MQCLQFISEELTVVLDPKKLFRNFEYLKSQKYQETLSNEARLMFLIKKCVDGKCSFCHKPESDGGYFKLYDVVSYQTRDECGSNSVKS